MSTQRINTPYGPLTEEVSSRLEAIVGPEHFLTDAETRGAYGSDETEDYLFPPDAVIKPRTAEQISSILKLANTERIPVTPRGGGTGLSGGAAHSNLSVLGTILSTFLLYL